MINIKNFEEKLKFIEEISVQLFDLIETENYLGMVQKFKTIIIDSYPDQIEQNMIYWNVHKNIIDSQLKLKIDELGIVFNKSNTVFDTFGIEFIRNNFNQYNWDDYTLERFFSKINVGDSINDCWEWNRYVNSEGYGRFYYDHKNYNTHRMTAHIIYLFDLNNPLLVCHNCDNPRCCNFFHLFMGTNNDNMQDKVKKCRSYTGDKVKYSAIQLNELLTLFKKNDVFNNVKEGLIYANDVLKLDISNDYLVNLLNGANTRTDLIFSKSEIKVIYAKLKLKTLTIDERTNAMYKCIYLKKCQTKDQLAQHFNIRKCTIIKMFDRNNDLIETSLTQREYIKKISSSGVNNLNYFEIYDIKFNQNLSIINKMSKYNVSHNVIKNIVNNVSHKNVIFDPNYEENNKRIRAELDELYKNY